MTGQLRIDLEVGPQHDGVDRVQLCLSITNTLPNDIDFSPNDNQKIVIQFGEPPLLGDFTKASECIDPQDFAFDIQTLTSTIDQSAIITTQSDSQDFEMAFKFNKRVEIEPDQSLSIGCIQNFDINCFCDSLYAIVDCSGIQHSEFFNGNIIISGEGSCPTLEFPPPDVVKENIDIFCEENRDNEISIGWHELADVKRYEVRINEGEWQDAGTNRSYSFSGVNTDGINEIDIRGITGCDPMPIGQIFCSATEPESKPLVYIPNAFSPNGDGIHDKLKITPQPGIIIKEMRIYERFGGLIYKSNITDNQGVIEWDVQNFNRRFGSQMFLCQVIVINNNDEEETIFGGVSMIK